MNGYIICRSRDVLRAELIKPVEMFKSRQWWKQKMIRLKGQTVWYRGHSEKKSRVKEDEGHDGFRKKK